MIARERLDLLKSDPRFTKFTNAVDPKTLEHTVKDAEFLLLQDGNIFNVEGWNHPAGFLVGEILYTPDESGDKLIFGQPYRKVSLYKGTFTPVPYPLRRHVMRDIDPRFDQTAVNPLYARYKQILPTSDFIAHFPAARALKEALAMYGEGAEKFHADFENLLKLLNINSSEISLGLTGAPLMGNLLNYHDLDLVFSGGLDQNREIARRMREIVLYEPKRRLFEGGKAWQIRFFNDNNTLMCTFFTYPSRENAPLNNFEMKVLESDITATGTVSDDTHSMYTPSLLYLKDVQVVKDGKGSIEIYTDLPLIIYHTASRGDCFMGDVIQAKGSLVEIWMPDGTNFPAICVIDREGVRNLTPPWENYYS